LKIFKYFSSLLVALVCVAVLLEMAAMQLLPAKYQGYLVETDSDHVTWGIGPFEPSQAAVGFNTPVSVEKPDDTIRIISVGASGTEGWLSAKAVFRKYGVEYEEKDLSSYSRALEFTLNDAADGTSKKVEIINLGVAAFNITDIIRSLKDAAKLSPDMYLLHIGVNEAWTAERSKWSSYISDDLPYLYSELTYEVLTEKKAGWSTLDTGGNAFNPLALFSSNKALPIVIEPTGRAPGFEERVENYREEVARLGEFLEEQGLPALFLIPTQNLADFEPFGSMAKAGTTEEELDLLNNLLLEALVLPDAEAKQKYLEIMELDDGIAEVNYQLAQIYRAEGDIDRARELLWVATDRDLVLKRPPSPFHKITREFVDNNGYQSLDLMEFFEGKSSDGLVGYNWIYDDVHPSRPAQFELASEVARMVMESGLLESKGYRGSAARLPLIGGYDEWVGFDDESRGKLAYLKAIHNHMAFGRLKARLFWDPNPARTLEPILGELAIANEKAPSDRSVISGALLLAFIGEWETSERMVDSLNCRGSEERANELATGFRVFTRVLLGRGKSPVKTQIREMLIEKGCVS